MKKILIFPVILSVLCPLSCKVRTFADKKVTESGSSSTPKKGTGYAYAVVTSEGVLADQFPNCESKSKNCNFPAKIIRRESLEKDSEIVYFEAEQSTQLALNFSRVFESEAEARSSAAKVSESALNYSGKSATTASVSGEKLAEQLQLAINRQRISDLNKLMYGGGEPPNSGDNDGDSGNSFCFTVVYGMRTPRPMSINQKTTLHWGIAAQHNAFTIKEANIGAMQKSRNAVDLFLKEDSKNSKEQRTKEKVLKNTADNIGYIGASYSPGVCTQFAPWRIDLTPFPQFGLQPGNILLLKMGSLKGRVEHKGKVYEWGENVDELDAIYDKMRNIAKFFLDNAP